MPQIASCYTETGICSDLMDHLAHMQLDFPFLAFAKRKHCTQFGVSTRRYDGAGIIYFKIYV